MSSKFYEYFKENMDGLGLDAPETLFGSLGTAYGTLQTLVSAIDKFGTRVTVLEVIGASTQVEALIAVGAVSAAGYAGACIGSFAVATGRTLSGGTSIADVMETASAYGLNRTWLPGILARSPEIYRRPLQPKTQQSYAHRAIAH